MHRRYSEVIPSGLAALLTAAAMTLSLPAQAEEPDWSIGAYAGQYHDTEPAGFLTGKSSFQNQYLYALTASKTIWRAESWPVSLELDGMVGWQSGTASLGEIAIAPALRISGFPWQDTLRTDLRLAPLGISYTTKVSPLEQNSKGEGSKTLNWLFIEVAFSTPKKKDSEVFLRLHHRCAIYDMLNNYGVNGEDFFAVGFRRRF